MQFVELFERRRLYSFSTAPAKQNDNWPTLMTDPSASQISYVVSGTSLNISGDASANDLLVSFGARQLLLKGLNGTLIGSTSNQTIDLRRLSQVNFSLGGGSDRISVEGSAATLVTFACGGGSDVLNVSDFTASKDFTYTGQSGSDTLRIADSSFSGTLSFNGGTGSDRLLLSNSHIRENCFVGDLSGSTSIDWTSTSVFGDVKVRTGDADDGLVINDCTLRGTTSAELNGGDDSVLVHGSVLPETAPIDAGTGNNTIDRQVILDWDFRDGANGWKAGFADYSGSVSDGLVTKIDDADIKFWRLQEGLQALPTSTGLTGTGFFTNADDDPFAYIYRPLTEDNGIVAKVHYNVSYKIAFASNEPGASDSMGNDPLMAGASGVRPAVHGLSGTAILNLDKGGSDNSGGSDLKRIGRIGNDTSSSEFRVTGISSILTSSFQSSGNGQLWLTTGHGGSSDTNNPPHSVYFIRISVILTPIL